MRVDARRNRQAVIEAARKRMAADGLDAQMTEIARAAGVGVGTVYRHFPTKDDLIEALAQDRFRRLAEFARDAIADADPGPAEDLALSEVMRDRPEAMRAAADSVDLLELTRTALTRAQDAGAVRRDAEAEDIPMLMCGLGTSTPGCQGPFVSPTSWRRFMAIVVDGLRAGGTAPMPPR